MSRAVLTLPCMGTWQQHQAASRLQLRAGMCVVAKCMAYMAASARDSGAAGCRAQGVLLISTGLGQQVCQDACVHVHDHYAVYLCCLLQVRSDCPPRQLVDFLLSDSGVQADQVGPAHKGCASCMLLLGSLCPFDYWAAVLGASGAPAGYHPTAYSCCA